MVFETPLGHGTQRLQPPLQMCESGDVLEAAVAEGRAVEALGRREPADLAVQAVVVVVANVLGQGRLGLGQRAEDLAVEDLGLEDAPEALDLAVRPGRVHLGTDVANVQLLQALAEAREHAGDPVHERRAVVGHELERDAAEVNALAQPGQDRAKDRIAVDAQTKHEARVVVDQADDPGLEASPRGELDEEGALDVDVPELVGPAALVARPPLRRQRRAGHAAPGTTVAAPRPHTPRASGTARRGWPARSRAPRSSPRPARRAARGRAGAPPRRDQGVESDRAAGRRAWPESESPAPPEICSAANAAWGRADATGYRGPNLPSTSLPAPPAGRYRRHRALWSDRLKIHVELHLGRRTAIGHGRGRSEDVLVDEDARAT